MINISRAWRHCREGCFKPGGWLQAKLVDIAEKAFSSRKLLSAANEKDTRHQTRLNGQSGVPAKAHMPLLLLPLQFSAAASRPQ